MSRRSRSAQALAASAAASVVAVALGGWGGGARRAATGSLPAARIVTLSKAALSGERTLALAGTIRHGTAAVAIKLESGRNGAVSRGVLDSNSKSVGFLGPLAYVAIGKTLYVHAAGLFWQQFVTPGSGLTAPQAAKIIKALSARWIVLGPAYAKTLTSALGALTNPRSVASAVLANGGSVSKRRPTKVRGVLALPIVSGGGGTLYVALHGPPLPIEVSGSGGGSSGTVVFTYPKSVHITAPRGARTLAAVTKSVVG